MLNCKETTRLISERLDRHISLWQHFNLRMHIMMCGACNAYKRQIEGLQALFGSRVQRGEAVIVPFSGVEDLKLSPQKREETRRLIISEASGNTPE